MRLRNWIAGAAIAPFLAAATTLGPGAVRVAAATRVRQVTCGTPTGFGAGLRDHLRSLP